MFQLYPVFLTSKFKSDLSLLVLMNFRSVNCASKILNHVGAPAPSPFFRPFLLLPKGWMDQDGTWREVGLGSGDIVLDGDPGPLPQKRGRSPNFRSILIVAKQLDASRFHLV